MSIPDEAYIESVRLGQAENGKLLVVVHADRELEVQIYLQQRAQAKGIEVNQLVNEMLRQEIKLIEAVK